MTIILVGLPGSGKSTTGRQLARLVGWRFVDSDAVIESELGELIRSHFEKSGEESFREAESRVLGRLAAQPQTVLATGGGAVLRPANRELLRRHGTVVYLRAAPQELARRLRHDTQRPLLQGADPLARLRELYAARDCLYREVAHFVIDSGRSPALSVVHLLKMQLELAGVLPVIAGAHTGATEARVRAGAGVA